MTTPPPVPTGRDRQLGQLIGLMTVIAWMAGISTAIILLVAVEYHVHWFKTQADYVDFQKATKSLHEIRQSR